MPGLLASAGRYIANNPSMVTGIGAGLGAASNVAREALRGDQQPKNYLGAGIQGALVGGLAGGSVAGLGRAAHDVHLLHPEISGAKELATGTAKHIGEGVSNFAQRQFHGLTGYGAGDNKYLDRIGMSGRGSAAEHAKLLNLRATDLATHSPGQAAKAEKALHEGVKAVHAEGELGQKFRDLGMTSAPGAVRGLATNPQEASKAIWNQLRSGGRLGVAAGVGIPALAAAQDISKGDERAHGGRGIGEKVLRAGANVGGGLLFSGIPIVPQMVAGGLAESAAGRVGRVLTPSRTPVASPAA